MGSAWSQRVDLIHDTYTTNINGGFGIEYVGDNANNVRDVYVHDWTERVPCTLESSRGWYEGKDHSRLFFPGFLANSSLNFPTALPPNPPPPLLPPSSMFAPSLLFSVRLGWLELPLPPRISENLLDLPFPPPLVLVATVVVCIAKAGIENLFFFLTVSSLRFGEAETLHLTFGGGLSSGLVGDSNTFSVGSPLAGENSPDVEIEVDRYPLAPAVAKPPISLFTPTLEGSRSLVRLAVNPGSDGLPSLKSPRIWR